MMALHPHHQDPKPPNPGLQERPKNNVPVMSRGTFARLIGMATSHEHARALLRAERARLAAGGVDG